MRDLLISGEALPDRQSTAKKRSRKAPTKAEEFPTLYSRHRFAA
jgi:hypothetical protein